MYAAGLDEIDLASEQFAQIHQQPTEVEQIAAGVEVDEDIDIAIFAIVAARDRSEHSNIPGAMPLGHFQNGGLLVVTQVLQGDQSFYSHRLGRRFQVVGAQRWQGTRMISERFFQGLNANPRIPRLDLHRSVCYP